MVGMKGASSPSSSGSCSSRFATLLGGTHLVTVEGGGEAITTLVMSEVTVVTPPPGVTVMINVDAGGSPATLVVGMGMGVGVRPGIKMLDRC